MELYCTPLGWGWSILFFFVHLLVCPTYSLTVCTLSNLVPYFLLWWLIFVTQSSTDQHMVSSRSFLSVSAVGGGGGISGLGIS